MFIYPNTTIKILHNVPLDPTYEHTIYFYSKAQQSAYFSSKQKYTLNNNTYQRVKKGWMRVNIQAEYLYDCNYLMFQNSAFGTKWFYAFIKQVEYVNDAVSEIFFEIDVMQTWHFDYLLAECFVEREHSISDEFGEHYLDEGLDIGDEYQITSQAWHFSMNEQNLCILMPRVMQGTTTETEYIGNISMPMRIKDDLYAENTQALDTYLTQFTDVSNIEMIYQYPRRFYNANHQPTTEAWFIRPYFHPEHGNGSYMEGLMSGSYQPRNNKLYCYPFNFILMSNNSGQTATYRWENWRDHEKIGRFMVMGCYVSTPMAMVYPEWYRGIQADYDSGLVYDAFPQVAWSSDAFRSWWAQKAGAAGVGIINKVLGAGDYVRNMSNDEKALLGAGVTAVGAGLLSTGGAAGSSTALVAAGAAMSNPVTAGLTIGAGALAYRLLSKVRDAYYAPNQLNGQVQTNSLNNNMSKSRFTAYYCTIKKEYAEAIDDYFDRYGYACRRNKKPFRVARKYWTYTKTVNCTLLAQAWDGAETSIISGEGGLAQDDAQAICNIYNTGITFWRYDADNGVDVGNYSQDNRVKVWHFPNIS